MDTAETKPMRSVRSSDASHASDVDKSEHSSSSLDQRRRSRSSSRRVSSSPNERSKSAAKRSSMGHGSSSKDTARDDRSTVDNTSEWLDVFNNTDASVSQSRLNPSVQRSRSEELQSLSSSLDVATEHSPMRRRVSRSSSSSVATAAVRTVRRRPSADELLAMGIDASSLHEGGSGNKCRMVAVRRVKKKRPTDASTNADAAANASTITEAFGDEC